MLGNLIKSILCIASVLVLTGCGDDKPTVKDLNSFRGNENELKFLTTDIMKITPIDAEKSKYDLSGTFQYPNNLYQFVFKLNGIKIFKEVSGPEIHSFEGNIVAGKNKEGWFITQSTLPSFDSTQDITKIMLIDPLTESEDKSYKIHPKLGSVLILDKEFPKRIHKLG